MHQRYDWELQTPVKSPVTAKFFSWDFSRLTLKDFNWIVSMGKSDLMDTIMDSSCGSKSKWALVHLYTCKAAVNRSNVYVSGQIIKYSIFLRQCKVYQPAQSQRKKGAKKNHSFSPFLLLLRILGYHSFCCLFPNFEKLTYKEELI
jgi:hypothetical protein